ncbi:hypothetical protein GIB67_022687, partial [Kingdonia uniflora]
MLNYHDLDEICGKSTATGQYTRSAKDLKSEKLSDASITQVQDFSHNIVMEDDSPLVNNKVEKTKKKSTGEGMIDALKSIASVVDGMKNRRSESEKKPNVIKALDAISGLLEGDYIKACDLIEDEGK